jgi:hypothetical protein
MKVFYRILQVAPGQAYLQARGAMFSSEGNSNEGKRSCFSGMFAK